MQRANSASARRGDVLIACEVAERLESIIRQFQCQQPTNKQDEIEKQLWAAEIGDKMAAALSGEKPINDIEIAKIILNTLKGQ